MAVARGSSVGDGVHAIGSIAVHARLALIAISIAVALAACFDPVFEANPRCGPGSACPDGLLCLNDYCTGPSCVGLDDKTACITSDIPDGVCLHEKCIARGCGDGIKAVNEACDDGNVGDGDGCSAFCHSNEICGNGIVDSAAGEQCEVCTDETAGEACDRRTGLSHDGCSSACVAEPGRRSLVARAEAVWVGGENLAYDPVRRRVLMFDGQRVWAWDGTRWWLQPSETAPPARRSFSVAFDSARRRLVLFGGRAIVPPEDVLGDTWEWDGDDWQQRTGMTMPAAREAASLEYDPDHRVVVMYGGNRGDESLDDTWVWNGNDWTERDPRTRPIRLDGIPPVTTYDSLRHQVMLYTAEGLWSWNGADWNEIPGTMPTRRFGAAFFYDPRNDRLVLFGGTLASGDDTDELWSWSGTAWTRLAPASPPPPMASAGFCYDRFRDRAVLFGHEGSVGKTWELGEAGFTALAPPPSMPPGRRGHAMAYDSDRRRTVLYGGVQDRVWEWDGAVWHGWLDPWPTPPGSPPPPQTGPPVNGHAMAYDRARGRTLLFAGTQPAETWTWDGSHWNRVAPTRAPTAWSPALAYDAERQRVVLFGGWKDGGQASDETWEWDGVDWRQRFPTVTPPPRGATAMAYDEVRKRVVLFGGTGAVALHDTWEWDGTTWRRRAEAQAQGNPQHRPAARPWPVLAFHAGRGRVILFGGDVTVAETWEWTGSEWLYSGSDPKPLASGAADARGAIVVFGGQDAGVDSDQTWVFDYVAPRQRDELCLLAAEDHDRDGLAGCDDPDCWTRCNPACPPHAACPIEAPHCGDRICQTPLEDEFLCPVDCR